MGDSAYLYELKFESLKDSALHISQSEKIIEMQTKYGAEKKELEIQKLNQQKLLDKAPQ